MRFFCALIFCMLLAVSGYASDTAQTPDDTTNNKEENKEKEEPEQKDSGIVPFPIVFYTDDTSVGFGVSAVAYKKNYETADEKRSDSVTSVFFYTLNNQLLSATVGQKYLDEGRWYTKGTLLISKYPAKFYGIGSKSKESGEESYTPFNVKIELSLGRRLFEKLYGGIVSIQGYYSLLSYDDGGLLSEYLSTTNTDGYVNGLGLMLVRDTRNASLAPTSGSSSSFMIMHYNDHFNSEYDFTTLVFDHKAYFPLPLESTLAWQVYVNSVFTGHPPLGYLPELGNQNLMRGYNQGRYRDNIYAATQVEWRVPIWWRIGAVLFAGVGNVKNDLGDFFFDDLKFAFGGGLRVTIVKKERINFRFDIGWAPGEKKPKLYFNILEAF